MALQRILIGVDLGTTNLKAAAFDAADGTLLAKTSARLATRVEADGAREQDADDIRSELRTVMDRLRQQLGDAALARVDGIGIAAQGGSGAVVNRSDGAAHTPLYLWNDSRPATTHLPQIAARRSEEYWRELSQRENPGMGLARMLWLREQDPTIFDRDRLYAGAGELAFHALTGVWRQDACNALQMGCYRVLEDRLDSEPLAIAGVSPECVAPLREGHRTAPLSPAFAAATGLPDGVPVAGPYMDHEAGYLSTVHVSERPLQVSLGTAWVGNFVTPSASSGWCPFQLVIPSPMVDGQALVIQPLLTGNVSWDWALTELLDRDLPTALVQADGLFSTRLLPPHGLMCIPWLTQANPYATGVRGGGGFWGVGPHVDRGDLLRALAAGMCFEFERVFAGVCSGGVVDCIVLGGGASRGNGFRRLLSALFPTLRAVAVQDEDVAGARGTLYAFDSPAGRAGCEDLDTVDSETRGVVEAGRQLYNTLFEREYGSHPLAAPYALR